MTKNGSGRRFRSPSWRSFRRQDGSEIERALSAGVPACCPHCRGCLEARPGTRVRDQLVLDACGMDLECRPCRRFCAWSGIRRGRGA
jgi:flavoprotein